MIEGSTDNQTFLSSVSHFLMRALIVFPLATFGLPLLTATASIAGDLPAEFLREIIDTAVARGVPGIVVRVETRDGEVWSGAAGLTRIEGGVALTTGDALRIFSISKMATAAAVLTLVDDGLVSLDDKIGVRLDADLVAGIPHGDSIDIGSLIAQTSGIREYFDDSFSGTIRQDPSRRWEPAELVSLASKGDPTASPGSDVSYYSNTNYVLLGLIIEAATDMPLAEAVRSRLLEPLGMNNSYSPGESGPALNVAGYVPAGGNMIDASGADLSIAYGAGFLTSTAEDVARLTRGLFESDLLSPESRALMTSGFRPLEGTPVDYGYGTFLFKMLDPSPIGHTGQGPGFSSVAAWWPESGTVVVILTNIQAEAHVGTLMEIAESLDN